MANIIMVIAQSMFRDEELFVTKAELERLGHTVQVASRKLEICRGSRGGSAMPDMTIFGIKPEEFDAIVLVGGGGASEYFEDSHIHELAGGFEREDKIVGAICIAPVILAKAGILRGRRATVFPSGADDLARNGASYTGDAVTQDGRIVTGNGPQSSELFARQISKALNDPDD
ncbi:MAG: DJ-1/PfpI family protein [Saccharofermentanales bacterium]